MGNSMGKNEKCGKPKKLIVVEFKVSMHCEDCECRVAKALKRFEGVEKFTTNLNKHRVMVKGRIDLEKLLKKLKKTTKMRVEIVSVKGEEPCHEPVPMQLQFDQPKYPNCIYSEAFMMLSDENPNACVVM